MLLDSGTRSTKFHLHQSISIDTNSLKEDCRHYVPKMVEGANQRALGVDQNNVAIYFWNGIWLLQNCSDVIFLLLIGNAKKKRSMFFLVCIDKKKKKSLCNTFVFYTLSFFFFYIILMLKIQIISKFSGHQYIGK